MTINVNAVLEANLEIQYQTAETDIGSLPLQDALSLFLEDAAGEGEIPWRVRLLENPASPVALPGNVDLHGHDCIHLLLSRGKSKYDEAFVIGFSMGNCPKTNWFHLLIFKMATMFFYPKAWQWESEYFKAFDLGVWYGKKIRTKNLTDFDFRSHGHRTVRELRQEFGIHLQALKQMWQAEQLVSDEHPSQAGFDLPEFQVQVA